MIRKTILAFTLCAVLVSTMAATSVVSACQSPIRVYPVAGANEGAVKINMKTGTFTCIACGLTPCATYYLQYHVTGRTGAAVIGSGVANPVGKVVITGKLDTSDLVLIQSPGDFLIGQYVV